MPKTRLQLRTSTSQSSDQPSTSKDDDRFVAKTPERADTGSKTPETEQPERPESPQNCSICLSGVENKSFTDSCLHTFCYVCLLEWSKVKAVCPLCKQPFKKLIHNVRSLDDFDEYVIPPPAPTRDHLWENFNASNYAMSARFRYRTTVTADRVAEYQRRRHPAGRYGRALGAPSTRAVSRAEERRRRQHQSLVSRRRVYDNDLWVQPVSPTSQLAPDYDSRYRETSPAFYSENEACRYQLIPWLSRELNILLNGHEDNIHFVLELILDLIQRFEIRSEEFYELIHPLIGRHARHFIHEFYHFARSPYNMMVYDERASYRTGRLEGERGERAHENRDESDEDEVMVLEEEASTEGEDSRSGLHHELSRRAGIPIANLGPINIEWNMTSALGDVRAFLQNVMNQESGAAQMARIHSHHNYAGQRERSGASSANLEAAATAAAAAFSVSPTTAAQPVNIEDESDEDDVIFVKYEKPYAERSPIMLSSESETEMAEEEIQRSNSDPSRRRRRSSESLGGQGSRSRERHRRDKRKKSDHKKSSRRRSPDDRSKSPDRRSRSRDKSSGSRDRRVRSPNVGSRSQGRRSKSHDKRSRSRDRRSRSRNRRSKSRDRPGSGARAYDLSVHRNRSPRSRDYITKSMSLDVPRPRDRRSRSRSRHRSPWSSSASRMQRRRSRSLERSRPRSHESSQRRHRECSTSRDRRRSRSRSRSVERRRKQDEPESRRRRHSSSDDVEITRIRRKRAKKHKKRKKHKKQNKRRRVSADDAGKNGGETAEEPSTSGENIKYKKHPTGHKSSKRKHSLDVLPQLSSVVVKPPSAPENVVSSGFESGDFSGDSAVDLTAAKTTNDTGDVINDVTEVTLTSQADDPEKTDESPSSVVKSVLEELVSRVVPCDEENKTKSVNFDSPNKPLEILANAALLDSVPLIHEHILTDQSLPLKLLDLSTKNNGRIPSLFDEFRDKNGVNIGAEAIISPTKGSDSDCIMTADDDVVFEGECRCRARQKCAKCLNSSDSSSSEDSDSDSDSGSISPVVKRRKFDSNASSPALPRFLRVGSFPFINSMFGTPPRRPVNLNLSGNRRSEPVRIDLDSGSDDESSAIIDVENSEPEIDVETVPLIKPDNVNIDNTTSDSDELNVESIERSVSPLVDPITVIDSATSSMISVEKHDSQCVTVNKSRDEPSSSDSSTQNQDLSSLIGVEGEPLIDVETLSSSPLKIGSPVLSSLSESSKIFTQLTDCRPLLESSAIADEVDVLSTSDCNVDISDLLSSDRDSPRPKTPQFDFDIDVENVDKCEIVDQVENVDETLVVDSSTDLEVDVEVSESN